MTDIEVRLTADAELINTISKLGNTDYFCVVVRPQMFLCCTVLYPVRWLFV